jgi:hypothetical protein
MPKLTKTLKAAFVAAALGGAGIWMARGGLSPSDREGAERILADDGRFTNPEYKGSSMYGCDKGSVYMDRFEVQTTQGKKINVLVCQNAVGNGYIRASH